MIKIGIVEDHRILRTAMVNLINDHDDFEVTIEASNGKELLEILSHSVLPDVILIDVEMPIMDGPTTVKEYRANFGNEVKLLGLSVHKEPRLVNEMIQNGANGFITKAASSTELFLGIKKVFQSGYYVSRDIASFLKASDLPILSDQTLNEKEEKILKLICQEKTNEEIATRLNLSRNTVNTYRTRMIEKLQVKNTVGLVLYAIKSGLYWVDN
ncbi:MAG: DNA-binding NarL/FixJ family response regulator [Bacteroidia bacterium]|jgi:DNA-binding NarL/FixJ family response regulator